MLEGSPLFFKQVDFPEHQSQLSLTNKKKKVSESMGKMKMQKAKRY